MFNELDTNQQKPLHTDFYFVLICNKYSIKKVNFQYFST